MIVSRAVLCLPVLMALLIADAQADANLIRNPSFEEQGSAHGHALYWEMNQPDAHGDTWGSASREDWRSRDGMYILTLRGAWAAAGETGGCWQEAAAEPEQTYHVSAWYWADEDWSPKKQEMKIEFWNADHRRLLDSKSISLGEIGSEWTQRRIVATAPQETAWVRVVILAEQVGDTGALQIDSLFMSTSPDDSEPAPQPVRALIEILDE